MADTDKKNSATGIRWNLQDLYLGIDDPAIEKDLGCCKTACEAFEKQYRGQIKSGVATPALLKQALVELEKILETLSKLGSYVGLLAAVDNLNSDYRKLEDRIDQLGVEIQNRLTFFDLEWLELDETAAEKFASDPGLAQYSHYLRSSRRYKPYTLSEPEELILNQKSLTARTAWVNLFDEFLASLKYEFEYNGEKKTLTQPALLSLVYDADRNKRRAAQECLYAELSRHELILTNIFNNLAQDHGLF